jgi:membrane associated rhomboid family serine protease
MLVPLKDLNPTRTFPFVNYSLIAANVVGYIIELSLISQYGARNIVTGFGLVPARLLMDPLGEAFTIFTSMFMHGDLTHIASNMLFLYIFGDNVEDALGHWRYLGFYLLSGVAAALAQTLISFGSGGAMIGASGAIAGVLGAYLVLYPRAPVLSLLVFVIVSVPAWLLIGLWFLLNLASGLTSLGLPSLSNVAFFAHIGGFLAGLLLVRPLLGGRDRRESFQWAGWRPPPRAPRSVSRSRYDAWRDR